MSVISGLHWQAWFIMGSLIAAPLWLHMSLDWADSKNIALRKISNVVASILLISFLGFVMTPLLIKFAIAHENSQRGMEAIAWCFFLNCSILMIAYDGIKEMLKCK